MDDGRTIPWRRSGAHPIDGCRACELAAGNLPAPPKGPDRSLCNLIQSERSCPTETDGHGRSCVEPEVEDSPRKAASRESHVKLLSSSVTVVIPI